MSTRNRLPDTLAVLERGWLSSNCIVGLDGESATLIDSGYLSHAEHTAYLLGYMIGNRRLHRLINTHVHSDHMGGNARIVAERGCRVTVPSGCADAVAAWDEEALILTPAGQRAERFSFDDVMTERDSFVMGELEWNALAVPGHDPHMLAFYNPDKRLLISGDALWRHGFGILFPALTGRVEHARDAFGDMRSTLEKLGRLSVDHVIPGHGAPFIEFDAAMEEAHSRLAAQEARADRLAMHALKALLMFRLLDLRRLERHTLADFLAALPLFCQVNQRFLGDLPADTLADRLAGELVAQGVIDEADGWLKVKS